MLDFPYSRTMRKRFPSFLNYLVCAILLGQHKMDKDKSLAGTEGVAGAPRPGVCLHLSSFLCSV
jgi:hypothetical protein